MHRLIACTAVLILAGCGQGGPPADLFVVERDGTVPGARLDLRITDDGGAYCNGGDRGELTSEQLLTAREIRRALDGKRDEDGLASRNARFAPGPRTIFSFRVRSEDGVVAFTETSRGLPKELVQLVKLTRDVARAPEGCDLSR